MRGFLSGFTGAKCLRTRTIAIAAVASILAFSLEASLSITPADATGSPLGAVGSTAPSTAPDPPLTPFRALQLSTPGGTIQAVIYDGANTTEGGSVQQALSGFTVPASPSTSEATAIVADGQLPGNMFTIAGSGAPLTDSNAFPGGDPHPSGWSFGGLWDTRNYNVSSSVAGGDVTVSDTASGSGGDCITSVAQVFATGPSAAFTGAGYVASGAGLRNQGSGSITVSGIPVGASVTNAYLFWANIDPTDPGEAMQIDGNNVAATTDGTDGSPCWDNGNIYTHSADVTPFVTGNGVYNVSGYATGAAGGADPWNSTIIAPLMEGASLVVFYDTAKTSGRPYYQFRNVASLRCLDADKATLGSNGTLVQLWGCTHSANQEWTLESNGTIVNQASGRCLTADAATINSNGTKVELWDCGSLPNQTWNVLGNGTIVNFASGRCLDGDLGTIGANGTKVQLWACTGGRNQAWEEASANPLPTISSFNYCPQIKPALTGTDIGSYKPVCAKGSDAWDFASAAPRSLSATGCPDPVSHGYSDVYCQITGSGSFWSGTANVDYVDLTVTWESVLPAGGNCIVYTEADSDVIGIATAPGGSRTESVATVGVPTIGTRGCG